MEFGATLRLLRVGAGVGLRDLAQRIGVSSAYLSRVENGHDPSPTYDRLQAIGRELGLPATLLLEMAGRLTPFLAAYIEAVPAAGSLFSEIAQRKLDRAAILGLRQYVRREFPLPSDRSLPTTRLLSDLVRPERVVIGVSARRSEDVLDIIAAKLGSGAPDFARLLGASLSQREQESSNAIGGGLWVPQALTRGAEAAVAILTMARPLRIPVPDQQPVEVVIAVHAPERGWEHLARLAQIARLARQGLVEALKAARTPAQVIAAISTLEAGL